MAKIDLDVTVSVEAIAHRLIGELLQKLATEHGLVVHRVDPRWIESVGSPSTIVDVELQTKTCPRSEP